MKTSHLETTQPSILVEATLIFRRCHTHLRFGQTRTNKQHSVHSFLYLTFSKIYIYIFTHSSTLQQQVIHIHVQITKSSTMEKKKREKNPHECMQFFIHPNPHISSCKKNYHSYAHRKIQSNQVHIHIYIYTRMMMM